VATTDVGDRYVLAELLRRGWALGGEQSGHIIDTGFVPSGDGTAAALLALEALGGSDLSERHAMEKLPQRLVNIRVRDRGALDGAEAVWDAVQRASDALEGRGRVLVRSSGTESLVRVMVEAPHEDECQEIVDRLANVLDRAREIAVLIDVPDELLGEEHLARIEVEQRDLIAEMVAQVSSVDRDRLVILFLLVLLATAAGVEPVKQDPFPIDLVAGGLLLLLRRCFLGLGAFLFVLFLRLDHLEERIVEELLLEVLLQVQKRHVQQIHRLIQARIDLELLAELRALIEAGLHLVGVSPLENRARSRAVSVGPR